MKRGKWGIKPPAKKSGIEEKQRESLKGVCCLGKGLYLAVNELDMSHRVIGVQGRACKRNTVLPGSKRLGPQGSLSRALVGS